MEITVNQTIRKYTVTANQTTRNILVTVSPLLNRNTIIVEQLGKRGFTGISAYEIAVKNGFVGTESQWLLSLMPTQSKVVINETPIGLINGSNATFTSLNAFVPETVMIFLNGMLQKIISDYNTTGNNTMIFTTSPEVNENISINYTKL